MTIRSAICLMTIPNALDKAVAVVYMVVPSEVIPKLPARLEPPLAAAAAAAAAATAVALKQKNTASKVSHKKAGVPPSSYLEKSRKSMCSHSLFAGRPYKLSSS